MVRTITNTVGFDDAPFARAHRGRIRLVGTVCARTRLDGVLSGWIMRDGRNATEVMVNLVRSSQFASHVRGVLLQGIAVGGFNVVDVHALSESLELPVLVVMRKMPNFASVERAVRARRGGERKWALIQAAGTPESIGPVHVQRVGLTLAQAERFLEATTLHGNLPEPLRLAHLIAGGVTTGVSSGRA